MASIKELPFFGTRHRRGARANTDEGVVFNEALALIRANADILWDKSFGKAETWTTIVSNELKWDHINRPSQYDSDAVVTDLTHAIAEAEAQKLWLNQGEWDSAMRRLKFRYGRCVEEYEKQFPEEHLPLAACVDLYGEYRKTVHDSAVTILDIFQTSTGVAQETRFKYELPRLFHLLPFIRGKAANKIPVR